jgi:hypothetical protein
MRAKVNVIFLTLSIILANLIFATPAKAEYRPNCVWYEQPVWASTERSSPYMWLPVTVTFKFFDPSSCISQSKVIFNGTSDFQNLNLNISRDGEFSLLSATFAPQESSYFFTLTNTLMLGFDRNEWAGHRYSSPQNFKPIQMIFSKPSSSEIEAAKPAELFTSCEELWTKYEGGIAKSKTAKNYKKDSKKLAKSKFKPKVSKKNYEANKVLDLDSDKIICER